MSRVARCSAVTVLVICVLSGCATSDHTSPRRGEQEWIEVSADGDGFELASSGAPFVPWGFNYDHDESNRLIEDYWASDWGKVEQDFREMHELGARVVRVHLQFAQFMVDAATPRERALDQLDRTVELAEDLGLYLDVTGLGAYRRADVPAWYDTLSDEQQRWGAQARFWSAVAARVGDSPAIFAYDLMNEPVVPSGRLAPGEWLRGELAGFTFVQHITFDRAGRRREDVARAWIGQMTDAIRLHDDRHLITVGLLPPDRTLGGHFSGFLPDEIASQLDFLAVHVYPRANEVDDALNTVEQFDTDKPVLIEETFNLYCTADELEQFIERSDRVAAGWLGFYWGATPDDLEPPDDLPEAFALAWLELFQELTSRINR